VASREEILAALRSAAPEEVPLPDLSALGAKWDDLRERFSQSVTEVGGRCVRVANAAAVEQELEKIAAYVTAAKVVSLVPGVRRANVELSKVTDPHDLNDVDFCVLEGDLAVAENGAVWVTNLGGLNRAVAFLAQHLAVVVRAETLVPDLHQAYQKLSMPAPGFSMFLSGPSKTADIEQALVIGAHGARSLTVLLVG